MMHKRTSALRYVFEYAAFFLMASWLLTLLQIRRGYAIVEAYNVPDAIVFVALIPSCSAPRSSSTCSRPRLRCTSTASS